MKKEDKDNLAYRLTHSNTGEIGVTNPPSTIIGVGVMHVS